MLASSSAVSWLALTRDQAQILNQIVLENGADIAQRWSPGILQGLCDSLHDIHRAGGAYIRGLPAAVLPPLPLK